MRKIITISREFGAYGGTIGLKVAEKLGYEFYNKEIILQAAKYSNVDMDSLQKWDEKVPINFGFAQSLFDFYNKPLNEKLFAAQKKVIREIGEKGNCVIVGRNANSILREFDNADSSEAKIIERMRAVDKTRRKYCSYYTNTEFGVADFYDLCLSSSTLGVDTCVDIICQLAAK